MICVATSRERSREDWVRMPESWALLLRAIVSTRQS